MKRHGSISLFYQQQITRSVSVGKKITKTPEGKFIGASSSNPEGTTDLDE